MTRLALNEERIQLLTPCDMEYHDAIINNLFKTLRLNRRMDFIDRFNTVSAHFLGRPYARGVVGEGCEGRFDQSPLYRTDIFDCVSYVNLIMAVLQSENLSQFYQKIIDVNYACGGMSYLERHHFVSVDWNPGNLAWGFLDELTMKILRDDAPVFDVAHASIDRPNWFKYRTLADIKLLKPISPEEEVSLLGELKNADRILLPAFSHLSYIPLTALFPDNAKPDMDLFHQIPSASVIQIIRPNWQLREKIGTNLNVSHMGFAVRCNDELIFRHASEVHKKVVDQPLIRYLYERLHSPTIKGISVFRFNNPACL